MSAPLYLITDGFRLRQRRKLVPIIESALVAAAGRISFVQVREQGPEFPATDDELRKLLTKLKPICFDYRARLLVSGNVEMAKELDLHGVHLGRNSTSISKARDILGLEKEIGSSAHSVDDALEAFQQGANYVCLGPIFSPKSKEATEPVLGVNVIRETRRRSQGTLFALGGVGPENAQLCRQAGADGVAVIGSVLLADDPGTATEQILEAWESELFPSRFKERPSPME